MQFALKRSGDYVSIGVHSADPAAKGIKGRQETEQALYKSTCSEGLALAHTQQAPHGPFAWGEARQ